MMIMVKVVMVVVMVMAVVMVVVLNSRSLQAHKRGLVLRKFYVNHACGSEINSSSSESGSSSSIRGSRTFNAKIPLPLETEGGERGWSNITHARASFIFEGVTVHAPHNSLAL